MLDVFKYLSGDVRFKFLTNNGFTFCLAHDAFNAFDFMGRGYIPAHDIKEALMFIMMKASKKEQEKVIKHFK